MNRKGVTRAFAGGKRPCRPDLILPLPPLPHPADASSTPPSHASNAFRTSRCWSNATARNSARHAYNTCAGCSSRFEVRRRRDRSASDILTGSVVPWSVEKAAPRRLARSVRTRTASAKLRCDDRRSAETCARDAHTWNSVPALPLLDARSCKAPVRHHLTPYTMV
jgi:hypothetical protein